ncbi:ribosomal protein S7 [Suhomyces tanzawaensis NRRL Y-17324]|uniref:Small ribosomal subunit protein uS7m n=1 Tax=Suhomyces tanzawaensis NRRL Y-17324 TaxID=984487 RepID=A0A1E4SM08_9ASCO|nr:ribosomal protein S7 [Suhomyces tanzawaensis NRRL Y-17324]ODV80553.1 ribosomal protein S7 [Suhomyces tanzawaensis NRRL Y-17324]
MSLIRACTRRVFAPCPRIWLSALRPAVFSRFNSNNPSLTAQVFPVNKDSITENDLDEWLTAVKALKNGKTNVETESEVYLSTLATPEPFLEQKFEPSEQQLAEVEEFANKGIPLKSDPIVDSLTNMIMRHGKKSKAQKIISKAFYIIYLKTRKDPVQILYETLDKLGPLVTTRTQLTGTAKNKLVPVPLTKKQRNRYAITWILDSSSKKKSPDFSVRLAEEIIAAYEGKSAGYDKKAQMHKTAMSSRANIQL